MKRILAAMLGLLGLVGLGGCERYLMEDIRPGVTTRAELKSHLGDPGIEWRNADGTVVWEYSMQPSGITCYHVTLDRAGVVKRVEQVLTEARMAQISAGMTEDQVRRLIGKPAKRTSFPNKGETVWDWLIDDRMPSESIYFNVHFDGNGRVTQTGRETVQRG
ncbi:outer membrane protein assembly factor BamE [Nitrogeniibacter mangrovi]|uniref:Outer membrane protein assembly factor BamE n=1 Tax=Nitrogeniibacter mangrovi TaxID=2016596 RepID=A0A6C1B973_9RHOO|nr:outer membrane protein assembly factor BamE [Nitrogeniibacter mangrovi]QID19298.1 outer membrane protein assembly factor BamE [Nitrogeniibacter mangrovi]